MSTAGGDGTHNIKKKKATGHSVGGGGGEGRVAEGNGWGAARIINFSRSIVLFLLRRSLSIHFMGQEKI